MKNNLMCLRINSEIIFLARHPNKKFDDLFKFKSLKNLEHDHKDLAKNRFFLGMNSNDKTYHLKSSLPI